MLRLLTISRRLLSCYSHRFIFVRAFILLYECLNSGESETYKFRLVNIKYVYVFYATTAHHIYIYIHIDSLNVMRLNYISFSYAHTFTQENNKLYSLSLSLSENLAFVNLIKMRSSHVRSNKFYTIHVRKANTNTHTTKLSV